jgi:hypothetical protein
MARHCSVPFPCAREFRVSTRRQAICLAAASFLAACLAFGAVASRAQATSASHAVAVAAHAIISPNDAGPCWSCGD